MPQGAGRVSATAPSSPDKSSSTSTITSSMKKDCSSVPIDANKVNVARRLAATGVQPRGRALAQAIPEHKEIVERSVPWKIAKAWITPRGQRTAREFRFGDEVVEREWKVICVEQEQTRGRRDEDLVQVKFGVPWSVSEFFANAQALDHPFQYDEVDDEVALAIFEILTKGPRQCKMQRRHWLDRWTTRAEELQDKEYNLFSSISAEVASINWVKRPLTLYEMLVESKFPAAKLCLDLLSQGIPMFGPFPPTGVFPLRRHEASKSISEIAESTEQRRKQFLKSMRPSSSKECDVRVYEKTIEERDEGLCTGPFSEAELDKKYQHKWLPARRFGVPQKGDFRPCDDYSEFGQNSTSDTWETVDTDGVDAIVAVAKLWVSAVNSDGRVRVVLSNGRCLEGRLNSEFTSAETRQLLARLVDLAKAYKQLAKDPRQSALAMFAVWNPHKACPELFHPLACGFGGRNVVFGFNLFARALKWLLATQLWIPVTHFFDDFSQIEVAATAKDGADAMLEFLDLVGWRYKYAPEDLQPLAPVYKPLGVVVDLRRISQGVIEVSNTAKRCKDVCEEMDRLEAQGCVRDPELASLYGKLRFSDNQCLGRCGAPGLRKLKKLMNSGTKQVDREVRNVFKFWRESLNRYQPREVHVGRRAKPILLFTDASAEGVDFADVGSGAVIFDPVAGVFEFFAVKVSPGAVAAWRISDQKQIIGQAELHPIACAMATWPQHLRGRDCLVFVDNNSAKDAIIRGDSSHPVSAAFVDSVRLTAATLSCGVWFERVPSPSNIADWPSRGFLVPMLRAGAKRVPAVTPQGLTGVSECIEVDGET